MKAYVATVKVGHSSWADAEQWALEFQGEIEARVRTFEGDTLAELFGLQSTDEPVTRTEDDGGTVILVSSTTYLVSIRFGARNWTHARCVAHESLGQYAYPRDPSDADAGPTLIAIAEEPTR